MKNYSIFFTLRRIINFIERPKRVHRFKHFLTYHIMRNFEPDGKYMLIGVNGYKAVVKKNLGMRYPTTIWVNQYYEKDTTEYLKNLLKPGDTVIDIGANFGYFTLLMAKLVGPNGLVIAFEPDAEMYQLLEYNIMLNKFDNIVMAVNMAAADRNAFLEFYINEVGGYSSLYDRVGTKRKVIVPCITLDSFHFKDVKFVKMDVECAELSVLAGMKRTIRDNPNMQILLEYAPIECGVKAVQFVSALPDYKLKFIDENGILARRKQKWQG